MHPTGFVVSRTALRARAAHWRDQLRIRLGSIEQSVGLLSGGNQQKVVFAMWLESKPSMLVLVDPTRGVDVGAKAEMHELVRSLADAGSAVILYSTDPEEMVVLADRVAVFYRGRCAMTLDASELDQHRLVEAMNTGAIASAAC